MNSTKKLFVFFLLFLCGPFSFNLLNASHKERVLVNQITEELSHYKNDNRASTEESFCLRTSENMCPTLYSLIAKKSAQLGIKTPGIRIMKGNSLTYLFEKFGMVDIKNDLFATSITSNIGWIFIGEQILTGQSGSTGDRLYDDELEAVLTHELAHIKHNHSPKKLGLGVLCTALTAFLGCSEQVLPTQAKDFINELFLEFLPAKPSIQPKSTVFSTWPGIASVTCSVLGFNAFSRYCESQADKTAATIINNPTSLVHALRKIRALKLDQFTWTKWIDSFFKSHPTLDQRARELEQIKIANNNKKIDRINREKQHIVENKKAVQSYWNKATSFVGNLFGKRSVQN